MTTETAPPPSRKRLRAFLASIAPGLFLIGYNIGTGSVTTMASSGAAYGLALTWCVVLSCVFTFVLIVAYGQFTAVTGRTALSAFREHYGTFPALFVLVALLFSEAVSVSGVMAVMVQVIQEWSRPLTASRSGFSPLLLAAVMSA
ncbi:MAG TPA: divalent metal cation transporter, partial [Rhodothermales bacterium]|nr:divalent metal cation transporter [Rhodothermales bacterium]